MATVLSKLSPLAVSRASEPGNYSDGGGLVLQVSSSAAKSWIFRYQLNGRAREMGIGSLITISLADARKIATECRKDVLAGIDPIEKRKAQRTAAALERAKAIPFEKCAEQFIAMNGAAWRNAKHAAQWASTLKTYAYPVIGHLPSSAVDTELVLKILKPIWSTKNETASRVRGRIETVLDWTKAHGYRIGENPARWRGHLDQILPKKSKVSKVRHHPALPFMKIGAFITALRHQEGISRLALEFLILNASRTDETLKAKWPEIDLIAKTWTIPAEHAKAEREHRIPLSARAIEILQALRPLSKENGFIFPGAQKDKPLSNMALIMVIRRMNGENERPIWKDAKGAACVPHGFRSTFRDWAAERTSFSNEVVEMALAHAIEDKTEAAYRRGDLFDKRRVLMDAWAKFVVASTKSANRQSAESRQAA